MYLSHFGPHREAHVLCVYMYTYMYQRVGRLYVGMVLTQNAHFSKQNGSESGSYKPFQTHTRTLKVLLYPVRPIKYVKYTANMCNTSLHFISWGYACCHKKMQGGVTHVMIVACPSLAFAFMLLLIFHAIITGFACIYCILFLYF